MGITANLAETTKIKPYIRHAAANYLLIQPNNFTVLIYLQNIPSFSGVVKGLTPWNFLPLKLITYYTVDVSPSFQPALTPWNHHLRH